MERRSSHRIIPWSIREAGLALGLPHWRAVLNAVLPAARVGVVTGVLIAFARAAGEAAPRLCADAGRLRCRGRSVRIPLTALSLRAGSVRAISAHGAQAAARSPSANATASRSPRFAPRRSRSAAAAAGMDARAVASAAS